MKQFLEYVVPNLVTHPEDVRVTEEEKDGVLQLMIQVNPEDVGRVIGKSGKIIKSLRQLVRVMAIKQGTRVNVDVADASGEEIETPLTEESPAEVEAEQSEAEAAEVAMPEVSNDEMELPQLPETEPEETPTE